MGSTWEEVDSCINDWADRLVDPSFDRASFRSWILKEYPQHLVRVGPFSIGTYPVTNGWFRRFVCERGGCEPESILCNEPDDHPVWGVSFEEATAFCNWMSRRSGAFYRLPTEAEWEYAARGPSGLEYPFGREFDPSRCNTRESGIGHTTPVDRYPQGVSGFGVWDLGGNVEEWTSSCYEPYPGGTFIEDDLARRLGRYRVLRGGSFARGGDLARSARRHGPYPSPAYRYRGFRVVREG